MQRRMRLLVRHFVRGHLSHDGALGGERTIPVSVAILVSPGLFVTVLFAAKYVVWPFPLPGPTALSSLFDRLLLFGTSYVVLALVALLQWDRLAVDARDGNTLGVLPLSHREIVGAKWAATAIFGLMAATLLNALPSLIHPIVAIGRLEATWSLVLQLTVLHFAIGTLAGTTGFLSVVALREVLWVLLGARLFARISAAVQGSLVIAGVVAIFLLPSWAGRQLTTMSGRHEVNAAILWLPPVAWVGTFEYAGGNRVAGLRADEGIPPSIRRRLEPRRVEYLQLLAALHETPQRAFTTVAVLLLATVLAASWNARARAAGVPPLPARRSVLVRGLDVMAQVMRRRESRAGLGFCWRTLVRSQPHRLLLAVGLAGGLAAGTLGLVDDPPQHGALADASLTVLSVQSLLVICLAGGLRAALRRAADQPASWIFALAWTGARAVYDTGVVVAATLTVCVPLILLLPVYWQLFGAAGALLHAAVGALLALLLVEVLVLQQPTLPLVEEAPATDAGRAVPALAVPGAVVLSGLLAMTERRAPALAITLLVLGWGVVHLARVRHPRGVEALSGVTEERGIELGLSR